MGTKNALIIITALVCFLPRIAFAGPSTGPSTGDDASGMYTPTCAGTYDGYTYNSTNHDVRLAQCSGTLLTGLDCTSPDWTGKIDTVECRTCTSGYTLTKVKLYSPYYGVHYPGNICKPNSCASGKYYNSLLATCDSCPTPSDSVVNVTSSGSTDGGITECFIASGSSFSDSTGRGTWTGKCSYTN